MVGELDLNVSTRDMCCECVTSRYRYERVGHVITGDLTVIRVAKLHALICKCPSYREQKYVDWRIEKQIWTQAVAAYKQKRSRREEMDHRVLNELEHTVACPGGGSGCLSTPLSHGYQHYIFMN